MIAAILLAATLAENVAAVTNAAAQIDAAIVAKGGTTAGGLTNAPAAIAALPSGGGEPEYPHPWRNDGKTHIWWYFGPNSYPCAYFNAQYISAGHTFTVNWGDGTTETIAASASFTERALSHNYSEGGEYEVVISGYDEVKITAASAWGSANTDYATSFVGVRQVEFAAYATGSTAQRHYLPNLVAIKYPEGAITLVTQWAFHECQSLRYAVGFGSMTASATGTGNFYNCFRLESIDLRGLEVGCIAMFANCSSLRDIGSLESLRVTEGNVSGGPFYNCSSLVSVGDMPALAEMGSRTFAGCTSLVSVGDMTNLTTASGNYQFGGCTSLLSVGDMPKLESFNNMFHGCSALVSVGDASSVASVGTQAFFFCDSIASLTFRTKTHTEVEAITGFRYFPDRGTNCVFHCSDGDYYRSGTSLLPMPTED